MLSFLQTMTNNDIEPIALENILNAKLTQLVASKNVKFKQYSHSIPMALGYYCFCFLPSGAGKDETIRLIDNSLMPFLKVKLAKIIDDYKLQMQKELYVKADKLSGKEQKEAKRQADEDLTKIRPCSINITDATFTGLYTEALQIEKTGYGALCLKFTEFADNVKAAISGDGTAKELLPKLKNIADGAIEPRLISGEVRHNIYGMATIAIMCCDYNGLLKSKENEWLMDYLNGGMARRSFVYIPKENTKININSDWKAREQAQLRALEISKWLEQVYDAIPLNMVCEFSPAAKTLLNQFETECKKEYNQLFKLDDIRSKEVKGAFWKITKLAVVKSVIDNPTCNIVDTKYVQEAIDFYKRIKPCLQLVIEKKADSPEDKLKKYLMRFDNGSVISRLDLRNQKFVAPTMFKGWIDEVMPQISEELGTVYGYNGKGNSKGWQIRF